MAKTRDRSNEKAFIVYRVSDWRLYYFNDPKAEIIESGLNYWEASRLFNRLNRESGEPIGRHKICHKDDWSQQIRIELEVIT